MKLLVFGFGYTASACVERLKPEISRLSVTSRSKQKLAALQSEDCHALYLDGPDHDPALIDAIDHSDALLVSIPPSAKGDMVLAHFSERLGAAPPRHVIYLSTIGVYGDFAGGWVDENTAPKGQSDRAVRRLAAENAWLDFGARHGTNVQILRLAGIYGPGRNALCDLMNGTARRLNKKDQVFNRIHVDDISLVVALALRRGAAGRIWNVADDEPGPPQDVVAYAAGLMGVHVPPLIDYESVDLSEMARAFYSENKRVSNRAIREILGADLTYPTYREGLAGLLAQGEGLNGAISRRQKDVLKIG